MQAFEGCLEAPGQRQDGLSFSDARDAFEENVAAGDEGLYQTPLEMALTDYNLVDLFGDTFDPVGGHENDVLL